MVWETAALHGVVPALFRPSQKYFSTAMEQPCPSRTSTTAVLPYLIPPGHVSGRRSTRRTWGHIPLDPDMTGAAAYVRNLLDEAKAGLYVRDGFASCFFHAFVDQ